MKCWLIVADDAAAPHIPSFIYFMEKEESYVIEKEYRFNANFRRYVDRYAENRGITVEEALKHEIVRQKFLMYTEV